MSDDRGEPMVTMTQSELAELVRSVVARSRGSFGTLKRSRDSSRPRKSRSCSGVTTKTVTKLIRNKGLPHIPFDGAYRFELRAVLEGMRAQGGCSLDEPAQLRVVK